ncbi:hypothetical protein BV898_07361 [Hypsibius exemplaris]|uniref:Uncharacterized protein n=1 Tax=Hypsibius exemplaris TaxID=2072580 RepID=A0A1W0WTL5_HYPEX|nr:hypothetical protein BV898_07361 [Hypsibius exemplaris]
MSKQCHAKVDRTDTVDAVDRTAEPANFVSVVIAVHVDRVVLVLWLDNHFLPHHCPRHPGGTSRSATKFRGFVKVDYAKGGVWCLEACNLDIDFDILFQEFLGIGQKISWTGWTITSSRTAVRDLLAENSTARRNPDVSSKGCSAIISNIFRSSCYAARSVEGQMKLGVVLLVEKLVGRSNSSGEAEIADVSMESIRSSDEGVSAGIRTFQLMTQGFNGLIGRLTRMEKELSDQKKEIADQKKEIADQKKEIADLKKEVADLKQKNRRLETRLVKKSERIRHLEQMLQVKGVSPYPMQLKKVKNQRKRQIAD